MTAPSTPRRTAVVVGGGPAGLMAAEVLAAAGMEVAVYELRRSVGRKLLLAGRSGLNLTHDEPIDAFVGRYAPSSPPLEVALRAFDPAWLRRWAAALGETTFVGSSGRVFPESFRAAPLLRAWLRRLAAAGVTFHTGRRWVGWSREGNLRFTNVASADGAPDAGGRGEEVAADMTVLALGGASWPRVGSDGSWADLLTAEGIEVTPLEASNCGVEVSWSAVFLDRFEGAPVKNVVVTAGDRGARGEFVITRAGLEGGPIYASVPALRAALGGATGAAPVLWLDLAPDLDEERLAARLAARRPKETQSSWLRRARFAPVVVGLLRESAGKRLPDDAAEIAALAKAAPLRVLALMPIERAISTAGGVSFAAVDDRFMLRDRAGTFIAGEMLDWDAPTGGYLLQACFATGAAAAEGAIEWSAADGDFSRV